MSNDRKGLPSPVSFPVNVTRLPSRGMPVTIEADSDQRAGLAGAHDLVSVEVFRADLTVRQWKSGGVHVTGTVRAAFTQTCVVTLEPLAMVLEEDVSAFFAPVGSRLLRPDFDEGGEILLDAEGPDGPEPFSGNEIDVGALAEEIFVLGIDPYPRKAGAALESPASAEEEATGPLHDKLKILTNRR